MPPDDEIVQQNQDALAALQAQVEQLRQENAFLREDRSTLENLVVSNITKSASDAVAQGTVAQPTSTAAAPPSETAMPAIPDLAQFTDRVVEAVDKKLIQPRDKEHATKQALADLQALANDPKTKDVSLYLDEMKVLARANPGLTMKQVFQLAKAEYGPKKPLAVDPASLRTGHVKPADGAERFSSAAKIRTRAEADDRMEKAFASASTDAWESVMEGKG